MVGKTVGTLRGSKEYGYEYKATWKRAFKLPWREAGPPNDAPRRRYIGPTVGNTVGTKGGSYGYGDAPWRRS